MKRPARCNFRHFGPLSISSETYIIYYGLQISILNFTVPHREKPFFSLPEIRRVGIFEEFLRKPAHPQNVRVLGSASSQRLRPSSRVQIVTIVAAGGPPGTMAFSCSSRSMIIYLNPPGLYGIRQNMPESATVSGFTGRLSVPGFRRGALSFIRL